MILTYFVFSIATSSINYRSDNINLADTIDFADIDIDKFIEDDQNILNTSFDDIPNLIHEEFDKMEVESSFYQLTDPNKSFLQDISHNTENQQSSKDVIKNINQLPASDNLNTNGFTLINYNELSPIWEIQNEDTIPIVDISPEQIQYIFDTPVLYSTNDSDSSSNDNSLPSEFNVEEVMTILEGNSLFQSETCSREFVDEPEIFNIQASNNSKPSTINDEQRVNLNTQIIINPTAPFSKPVLLNESSSSYKNIKGLNKYSNTYKTLLENIAENCLDIKLNKKSKMKKINYIIDRIYENDCKLRFKDELCKSDFYKILKLSKSISGQINDLNFKIVRVKIRKLSRKRISKYLYNPENLEILKLVVFEELKMIILGFESFIVKQSFLIIISNPDKKACYENLFFLLEFIRVYFKNNTSLSKNQYYGFIFNLIRTVLPHLHYRNISIIDLSYQIYNERIKPIHNADFILTTFSRLYLSLLSRTNNVLLLGDDFKEIENSYCEVMSLILKRTGLLN